MVSAVHRSNVGKFTGMSAPIHPGQAYLDHAASAPLRSEARDAMLEWLGPAFGNPSGSHARARAARAAIEDARDAVAHLLGAAPRELVFTGGGTEALNLAIAGAGGPGAVVTSAIEHDAVRNAAAARGGAVELPVDPSGLVDLEALAALLAGDRAPLHLAMVAVMSVNNEVGTVQPVVAVADMVRAAAPTTLVLVDAVQGAAWLDLRLQTRAADLLAISAHKFGGPQGVGALVVREGTDLRPILHGGGQERERRSGTQNVAGIVGMAAALTATAASRDADRALVRSLRDRLVDGLVAAIPGCTETVARAHKVAGNAHVCIEGVESESLLVLLDDGGVCASAGSACASGAIHTSPVLQAMGVPQGRAEGALRLTLGPSTTADEVDLALRVVPEAVRRLRD